MTLQQKLLAKQSKKGFTLVELVVVIAILAILAAIAIPAVVNIINSANTSSAQTNAASIDQACKDYYAGIISGTVNKGNTSNTDNGILPEKSAAATLKKSSAKVATIGGALEWNGISDKFSSDDSVQDYYYCDDGIGTITYRGEESNPGSDGTNNYVKITLTTALGDMYKK